MKYSYELMDQVMNSKEWSKQGYMFREYGISEATYYRWLKKYREGVGADDRSLQDLIKSLKAQHKKEMDQKCEEFVLHANGVMDSNLKAFTDHVNSLLIVHCDTDLEDLLANTKAVYKPDYFGCG